jgi:hypothetical protein
MVFPLVLAAAFTGAALVLRTTDLGAATALAAAFLTGFAATRFAAGAGFVETTGFAVAIAAGLTSATGAATTGFVGVTGAATALTTGAEFTLVVAAATLSTFFAFSAGTLATIGLHHCYVAVHNIEGFGELQALFVQCTKYLPARLQRSNR